MTEPRSTVCTCGGCGADITATDPHTFSTCRNCEEEKGFAPFERGQRVRVWPGWMPGEPGETDLAGLRGFIVARYPTGAFGVALCPEGYDAPAPFALFDNEIEPIQ